MTPAAAPPDRAPDRPPQHGADHGAERGSDHVPDRAAERAEAERLFAALRTLGADPVEADILQPAGTLLDLYGEDIRARAYVTADPLRGELMLRPDFTVPVVQRHMADGAEPARYTYMGPVFRRQEHRGPRASEYLQVGFELFDGTDLAAADAEVFATFATLLAPLSLRPVIGDIGLLTAAVAGLDASPARKAALRRHIWRPGRFRALLDRFGGRTPPTPDRHAHLQRLAAAPARALIAAAGPLNGLRTEAEIAARIAALRAEAAAPPIPAAQVAGLEALMTLAAPAPDALDTLHALAPALPGLATAADRFAARLRALADRGVAVDTLAFEAAFGRTTLEYYDGFVFGFLGGDGLPPVATGGRYDALTAVLGAGRAIPAVGGVIRPALTALLAGARVEGQPGC
ncbi:MAG: ATP phosphoribosyltransferase regulatory subunit [Alkalilacustris sp.]